jgi:hypothetical protein
MILGAIPALLEKQYEKRKKKEYEEGLKKGLGMAAGQVGKAVTQQQLKKGGKVSKKPRGVGCAQRGYGKALTGRKK